MPNYYLGSSFTLFATDPRRQVWPHTTFRYFRYTGIAASGTQILFVEQTTAGDNDRWLLGANNVLSYAITKDEASGGLRVDIDPGNGTFYESFMFPLSGEDVMDTLTGFELGGMAARFMLVNGLAGPTIFTGWIQLRSW